MVLMSTVVTLIGSSVPVTAADHVVIVSYPLDNNGDGSSGTGPDALDSSLLTGSTISAGPGLGQFIVDTDSWSGSVQVLKTGPGETTASASAAVALSKDWYFEITLTPRSTIHLTSVSAQWSRGGTTGVRGWFVRSSLDGYSSDLYANQTPDGTSTGLAPASFELTGFTNITTPVTFRFYIYTTATGRYMDFQNIVFYRAPATTTTIPPPPPPPPTTTPTTTTAPTTTGPVVTTPVTTTPVTTIEPGSTPFFVNDSNQVALTRAPGTATTLIDGVEIPVEVTSLSDTLAGQIAPEARSAEQVADLHEAADRLVTQLNTLAGRDVGVSVQRTDTGAMLEGLFATAPVPIEDVVLVETPETVTLVAAMGPDGRIVEVQPGAVLELDGSSNLAVMGTGLSPGEVAELVIMSDPTLLDTIMVGADGTVRAEVMIPEDLEAGDHTIVIAQSGHQTSLGIQVTGPEVTSPAAALLPTTGDDRGVSLALVMLGLGLAAVVAARRRLL